MKYFYFRILAVAHSGCLSLPGHKAWELPLQKKNALNDIFAWSEALPTYKANDVLHTQFFFIARGSAFLVYLVRTL